MNQLMERKHIIIKKIIHFTHIFFKNNYVFTSYQLIHLIILL